MAGFAFGAVFVWALVFGQHAGLGSSHSESILLWLCVFHCIVGVWSLMLCCAPFVRLLCLEDASACMQAWLGSIVYFSLLGQCWLLQQPLRLAC
jgi:hypothetical protein